MQLVTILRPAVTGCALFVGFSTTVFAQQVTIKSASPTDVVVAIQKRLSPQGFRLVDSSSKKALFTLDRGLVSQKTAMGMQSIPVVLELQLRFKQKTDSLQVDAREEVVGATGSRQLEFRKPVQNTTERESMQRLLDDVKAELEARPASP